MNDTLGSLIAIKGSGSSHLAHKGAGIFYTRCGESWREAEEATDVTCKRCRNAGTDTLRSTYEELEQIEARRNALLERATYLQTVLGLTDQNHSQDVHARVSGSNMEGDDPSEGAA